MSAPSIRLHEARPATDRRQRSSTLKKLSTLKQFLSRYIPEDRLEIGCGWRSLRTGLWREPIRDDLRCKLLEAYEAGRGSLQELAKEFGVSWGYSKKIRAQQLKT